MSTAARALSSIEEYRRASRNSGSGNGDVPAAGNADMGASLCARELQALELLAQGLADKEIGRAMHISVRTVQNHPLGSGARRPRARLVLASVSQPEAGLRESLIAGRPGFVQGGLHAACSAVSAPTPIDKDDS